MNAQAPYQRKRRANKKITSRQKTDICDALASGRSITSICNDPSFPSFNTVQRLIRYDEEFRKDYMVARDVYYQKAADELLDIADDSTNDYVDSRRSDGSTVRRLDKEAVMRSGLRIETRKWLLSKMLPKNYGAKELDQNSAGKIVGDLKDLIHEVVSVARGTKPSIEAEVIEEVKQIAEQ